MNHKELLFFHSYHRNTNYHDSGGKNKEFVEDKLSKLLNSRSSESESLKSYETGFEKLLYMVHPSKLISTLDKCMLNPMRYLDYMCSLLSLSELSELNSKLHEDTDLNIQVDDFDYMKKLVSNEIELRQTPEYLKLEYFRSNLPYNYDKFHNGVIDTIYSAIFKTDPMNILRSLKNDIDNFTDEEMNMLTYISPEFFSILFNLYCNSENQNDFVEEDTRQIVLTLLNKLFSKSHGYAHKVCTYAVKMTMRRVEFYTKFRSSVDLDTMDLGDFINNFNLPSGVTESVISHIDIDDEDVDEVLYNEEIESNFDDLFLDLIYDENIEDTIAINKINGMMSLAYLSESKLTRNIRKGAEKIRDTNRKGASLIKQDVNDLRLTGKALREVPKPFENLVSNTFNKVKDMDTKSRREAIITGGLKGKLLRLIRLGVKIISMYGSVSIAGPIIGSIAILAGLAIDNKLDYNIRKDIIDDLDLEHRLVKEKLDDSRGDNDKKAKYELMRIEARLDKESRRIKSRI